MGARAQQSYSGYYGGDVRLVDFSGGLMIPNTSMGVSAIPANYLVKATNVDTAGRSIRKQLGFSRVTSGTVAGDISNFFYDEKTQKVYVSYADKWGEISGTTINQLTGATGFTNNATWYFSRNGVHIFGTNGTDAPRKWNSDTSTLSTITTPPVTWTVGNYPTVSFTWMGRTWAWVGDILYYSKLYDCDVWTAGTAANDGGAITIGNDGQEITCVIPLARGLLIFKKRGCYILTGSSSFSTSATTVYFDQTTFDWTQLSPTVGATSPRGYVVVDERAYVWGISEVYEIAQTNSQALVEISVISQNIAPAINDVVALTDQITAVHYPERRQIWFAVAKDLASTTIDTVYCYDYYNVDPDTRIGGWFIREGYEHKVHANVLVSDKLVIYSGGYSGNSYVFRQNLGRDFDTVAMSAEAWTAWIPLGNVAKGRVNETVLYLAEGWTQSLVHSYAYDFNNSYNEQQALNPPVPSSTWTTITSSTYGSTFGSGSTGSWVSGSVNIQAVPIS